MTSPWSRLSEADLRQLGGTLQAGRLTVPFSAVSLQRYLVSGRKPYLFFKSCGYQQGYIFVAIMDTIFILLIFIYF